MKNLKEKIIDIFYKIIYIVEFILCLIEGVAIFNIIVDNSKLLFLIISILVGILIILLMYLAIKKYNNITEKMFLLFAIPIGILYMIFLFPTYVPDENYHAARAYQISEGQIIVKVDETGDTQTYIPKDLEESGIGFTIKYSDLAKRIEEGTNYSDKKDVYTPTQGSSAILYIFSSLGFLIGRILNLDIILGMYLARMFNLIVSLILGYYSIKLIPFGKKMLMIYMFTPMYFQQAASVSYDCLINAVCVLFIAYMFYLIYKEKDIVLKERILYYILIAIIAINKYVYIPLVGIAFLLIRNDKISKKNKIKMIVIGILLAVTIALLVLMFSGKYVEERDYIDVMNVNASQQISNIIQNPLVAVKVLFTTLKQDIDYYLFTFVGSSLAWLSIDVNNLIIATFIVLLVGTPFLEKSEKEFKLSERIWSLLIFAGISILIIIGLYIGWSPVGNNKAIGIQGRYFIPCALLGLLCLTSKTKYIEFKKIDVKLLIMSFILNLLVIMQVIGDFTIGKFI